MNKTIYGWLLLGFTAVVLILSIVFFRQNNPIEAEVPLFTMQEADEAKTQREQEAQKRQNMELARKRSEIDNKMTRCSSDDECVIVDKDPCGCLKGPSGVTAINGAFSLEFTNLMEKKFGTATACPSVAPSLERECSPTAEAVCREKHCKIVY